MASVFLASPVFHQYWSAISQALQARGHEVTTYAYDGELGPLAKLRVRRADQRLRARLTERVITRLRASQADVVVTIKGDLLTEQWWAAIADKPKVTWLYDELRRTQFDPDTIAQLGPVASYSPGDVARLQELGANASYLPLAFDQRTPTGLHPDPGLANVVTLVGARYPNREAALSELTRVGVRVRAYGRDWSGHACDRVRTGNWRRAVVPGARELPRPEAYDVMAASAATLNLHADQDGFTMRTFEACGVGAVQFLDRADVAPLYEPGLELACFRDLPELVSLCQRAVTDRGWADQLRAAARKRTLAEHTFDHRVAVLESLWD